MDRIFAKLQEKRNGLQALIDSAKARLCMNRNSNNPLDNPTYVPVCSLLVCIDVQLSWGSACSCNCTVGVWLGCLYDTYIYMCTSNSEHKLGPHIIPNFLRMAWLGLAANPWVTIRSLRTPLKSSSPSNCLMPSITRESPSLQAGVRSAAGGGVCGSLEQGV